MKTRNGFVSNSSSSSFLIFSGVDLSKDTKFFQFNYSQIVQNYNSEEYLEKNEKINIKLVSKEIDKVFNIIKKSETNLNRKKFIEIFRYHEKELCDFINNISSLEINIIYYEYHKMMMKLYKRKEEFAILCKIMNDYLAKIKAEGKTNTEINELLSKYREEHKVYFDLNYDKEHSYRNNFLKKIWNTEKMKKWLSSKPYVYYFNLSDGGGCGLESELEYIDWLQYHEDYNKYVADFSIGKMTFLKLNRH
jgi:hypothetical protein